jgi:nicotinamidase-related amidase
MQIGLYQLTRDWDPTLYYNNMLAHAALGKLFYIPVILTTSAQTGQFRLLYLFIALSFVPSISCMCFGNQREGLHTCLSGPNGPLPKQILEMYPNATLVQRQGEVDAWDNPDFSAAVRATGRRQIILAGIATDVCE